MQTPEFVPQPAEDDQAALEAVAPIDERLNERAKLLEEFAFSGEIVADGLGILSLISSPARAETYQRRFKGAELLDMLRGKLQSERQILLDTKIQDNPLDPQVETRREMAAKKLALIQEWFDRVNLATPKA